MIVLCENCFKNPTDEGIEHEVLTILPITPCSSCGALDQRWDGRKYDSNKLQCYAYRTDPRKALDRRNDD